MDVVGSGEYSYVLDARWGEVPEDCQMGDVAAVGVDSQDRVFVFHRGVHPMLVFDRTGKFLTSWGDDVFTRPHGLQVTPEGLLWCTDDGDHTVRLCTPEGQVRTTIGSSGRPVPFQSGLPFNRCTHTALSPEGDLYISDGYGNARIHKYSPDGRRRLLSWGGPGIDAGQFNIPHNIACDRDGWVYVADRENHRIQIFDGIGGFQEELTHLHRPSAMCLYAPIQEREPVLYVGEIGPYLGGNLGWPNLGPRISILSRRRSIIARLGTGTEDPVTGGTFVSPHGIALDSHGDIYVADVCRTGWPSLHPGRPAPVGMRGLYKLARLESDRSPGHELSGTRSSGAWS